VGLPGQAVEFAGALQLNMYSLLVGLHSQQQVQWWCANDCLQCTHMTKTPVWTAAGTRTSTAALLLAYALRGSGILALPQQCC
jgi:hypothetical protein